MAIFVYLVIGLLLLGGAAGAGFYYVNGINKVGLETFDLRGIANIRADSFSFDGDFLVKNPSKTPVPVQGITYDVILKETGEVISSGSLPSFILATQDTTTLPFDERVNWIPTVSLATQLATKSKVYAIVKGSIRLDLPKVRNYEIPFSKEVDIKPFIMQFVPVDTTPITSVTEQKEESDSPLGVLS